MILFALLALHFARRDFAAGVLHPMVTRSIGAELHFQEFVARPQCPPCKVVTLTQHSLGSRHCCID